MSLRALKPSRLTLALLLPGIGFLLLELVLEPEAVIAAIPGLLIWAALVYVGASAAVALRGQNMQPAPLRALLLAALLLAAFDQTCKLLVLRLLPLEWEQTLVPGALTLAHGHNLHGSWLAAQFDLTFIGKPLLIALAISVTFLALSLYRYYVHLDLRPSLWADIALVGFVAAMSSAFVDLALRGFTVDYLGVAGLVVADLKDFYVDVAIAALFAELAENWRAARHMTIRQTFSHLKRALSLTVRDTIARFRTKDVRTG